MKKILSVIIIFGLFILVKSNINASVETGFSNRILTKVTELGGGGGSSKGTYYDLDMLQNLKNKGYYQLGYENNITKLIKEKKFRKWTPTFTYNYHLARLYEYVYFNKMYTADQIGPGYYHDGMSGTNLSIQYGIIISNLNSEEFNFGYEYEDSGGNTYKAGYKNIKETTITYSIQSSYSKTFGSEMRKGYYAYYAVFHTKKYHFIDTWSKRDGNENIDTMDRTDNISKNLYKEHFTNDQYAIRLFWLGDNNQKFKSVL